MYVYYVQRTHHIYDYIIPSVASAAGCSVQNKRVYKVWVARQIRSIIFNNITRRHIDIPIIPVCVLTIRFFF